MSFKYNRLDKDNVVLLMVDRQAGLLSLVRDFSPDDFKNNVLVLADIAKFFGIPTEVANHNLQYSPWPDRPFSRKMV